MGFDLVLPKTQDQIRFYESVIILDPELNLESQREILRKNRDIIHQFGGSIHSLDTWGRRTLGNPIGKKTQGIYFHILFKAKPAAIAELERVMRLNDKVLRFLHVRLDERIPLEKHEERIKALWRETAEKDREPKASTQRNT